MILMVIGFMPMHLYYIIVPRPGRPYMGLDLIGIIKPPKEHMWILAATYHYKIERGNICKMSKWYCYNKFYKRQHYLSIWHSKHLCFDNDTLFGKFARVIIA